MAQLDRMLDATGICAAFRPVQYPHDTLRKACMWLKTDTGGGVRATASTIGSSLCSPMLQHHAHFQLGRSGQHIVSRQRWHCEGRTDAASAPDSRWQRGRRIPPRIGCTPCPCGACTGPPQKLSAHKAQYAAPGLTQVAKTLIKLPRHTRPCASRATRARRATADVSSSIRPTPNNQLKRKDVTISC